MKYALVPIQKLMKPHEKIISLCTAGVYVGELSNNLITPKSYTLRLIKYNQKEKVSNA